MRPHAGNNKAAGGLGTSRFPGYSAAALSEHHSLDASLRSPLDLSLSKQEACQPGKIQIQNQIQNTKEITKKLNP